MCYSATASFISATVMSTVGLLSIIKAHRINRAYLLLAGVPLFFSIQQIIEGLIWLSLNKHVFLEKTPLIYFYLFFAFFFWPCYMPLAVSYAEHNVKRAHLIFKLFYLGLLLGIAMYSPLILGWVPVNASVMFHSIFYQTYQWPWLAYTYGFFYALTGIFPFLLATRLSLKIIGLIILASMVLSHAYYAYAFTSIWCYFVAVISLAILFVIRPIKN